MNHSMRLKKVLPGIIEDLMKVPLHKGAAAKVTISSDEPNEIMDQHKSPVLGMVDKDKGPHDDLFSDDPNEEAHESPSEKAKELLAEGTMHEHGEEPEHGLDEYAAKKAAEPSLMDRFKRNKKRSFLS